MSNREIVMQFARNYSCSDSVGSIKHNGIDFYCVGHNASHEFYLGVDENDCIWKYSVGESDWNEEENMPNYSEHIRQIGMDPNMIGYCGHY